MTREEPGAPAPSSPGGAGGRAIPWLLFAISFLQVTDNQAIPVIRPTLRTVWPGENIAALIAAYTAGAAVLPFLATLLAARFTGRVAVLAGIVVLAAADVAFALEPSYPAALALRAVAGAASGTLSFALLTVAVATGLRTSEAVAGMTAGFLCALVAGIPAASFVVAFAGVRATFLGLAALALLAAWPAARLLPAARVIAPDPFGRALLRFVRAPELLFGLLASVAIAAAIAGPVTIFPEFLHDAAGLDQRAIGTIFLAAGLGPIAAFLGARPLVRRAGAFRTAFFGNLLLIPPLLLLPTLGASFAGASLLLLLAIGIETARRSAFQEHLALLPAPDDRGRYLTLRNLLVQLGIGSGALAADALYRDGGLLAVVTAAAALAALSALLVAKTRRASVRSPVALADAPLAHVPSDPSCPRT